MKILTRWWHFVFNVYLISYSCFFWISFSLIRENMLGTFFKNASAQIFISWYTTEAFYVSKTYSSISHSSVIEKDRIPQSENDFTPKLHHSYVRRCCRSIFSGMLGIITMCTQYFLGVEKMYLLFQVFSLLIFFEGGLGGGYPTIYAFTILAKN